MTAFKLLQVDTSKMLSLYDSVSSTPPQQDIGNSVYLYSLASMLILIGSIYCFYKARRDADSNHTKSKKVFLVGMILFVIGVFLLAYSSFILGNLGQPGFDPRLT